tara:strand:+ start:532 stop:756 length:225 start_codon:yes stop_codon:yes gene_type:complete
MLGTCKDLQWLLKRNIENKQGRKLCKLLGKALRQALRWGLNLVLLEERVPLVGFQPPWERLLELDLEPWERDLV